MRNDDMNHTLKSLLALLLCVAMLVCAVACKPEDADQGNTDQVGEPDTPDTPDTPEQPDPPAPVNSLAIVLNNEAKYRVARGDIESAGVRNSAMALIAAIEAQCGVRPTPITDYEAYDANVKEIIVGKANNRPATASASTSSE